MRRALSTDADKHTKLDGFNQVLRITFPTPPEAEEAFSTVISRFAQECIRYERPHLQKFDIMRELNKNEFVVYQSYNSREGFLQHRTSTHFEKFMHATAPIMTDDVKLSEFKSIFPAQEQWQQPPASQEEGLPRQSIQVSMTVQEDKTGDFVLATQRHCEETIRNSAEGPAISMFLLQNTKEQCDFELIITVHENHPTYEGSPTVSLVCDAVLKRLKESASYLKWSTAVQPWFQSPRRSKRFLNINVE